MNNYSNEFHNNLNLWSKKIEKLENSCSDLKNDLDHKNDSMNNSYKNDLNQSYNNSMMLNNNNNQEFNKSKYLYGNDKYINNLLNEIDKLKHINNKLENENKIIINRSQKNQKELIDKINLINDLKINLNDKIETNKKLNDKIKVLDNELSFKLADINKELIRLKTQYDLSIIEINTLENDKSLFIEKNNELKDRVIILESENRIINEENNEIKLLRCELEKNFELYKKDTLKIDQRLRDLDFENKNLKHDINVLLNEKDNLIKKLDIYNVNSNINANNQESQYYDHDITIKQDQENINKENYLDLLNKFNNLQSDLKQFKNKIN